MQTLRAPVSTLGSAAVRKPAPTSRKQQNLQASVDSARDLSNQVHGWYVAARHHLAHAHRCDQQIVKLQGRMDTLEKTLGRASPILVGAGAPLWGFGEMIHAGALSHGALGLLAAGVAASLAWVGGTAGLKHRIALLSRACANDQDQIQNYTRLAEALDPERPVTPQQPRWMNGLQAPRASR